MAELQVGSVVVIDDKAWTVTEFRGRAAIARSEEGALITFASAEVDSLGSGLWCLPRRTEASLGNANPVVLGTAIGGMSG